jgi:hypothetical protein
VLFFSLSWSLGRTAAPPQGAAKHRNLSTLDPRVTTTFINQMPHITERLQVLEAN